MNKRSIIDVRTSAEFASGHVKGSRNIPLQEIGGRLKEIQDLPKPVILCCASGNRSAQAEAFLEMHHIPCINAGNWTDVELFMEANKMSA